MSEPRLRVRTERAVQRGRDASAWIKDQIENLKAKGHQPETVVINRECADNLRAFFESHLRLSDGVLPKHCHGVPMFLDLGADKPAEVRFRRQH
jgi:hypothetical protein